MKRSEMIAKICETINEHTECCNEWAVSEMIMMTLERSGMKPPTVSGTKMPIGYNAEGEVAAWDVSGNPVNAWEPEKWQIPEVET